MKNIFFIIIFSIATINVSVFSQQKTQTEVFLESQITLSPFSKIPTIEEEWNRMSEEFSIRTSEDFLKQMLDSVNIQISLLEKDSVIEKIIEKKLRTKGLKQSDISSEIQFHTTFIKLLLDPFDDDLIKQADDHFRMKNVINFTKEEYLNIKNEFEVIKYNQERYKLKTIKKFIERQIENPTIVFSKIPSKTSNSINLKLGELLKQKSFPNIITEDKGIKPLGQYIKFEWLSRDDKPGWALGMTSTFTLIEPLNARFRLLRYRNYIENKSKSAFTIYGADFGFYIPILTTTKFNEIYGNRDVSKITARIKTEAPIFIRPFIGQLEALSFESDGTKWFKAMFQPGIDVVASYWYVAMSIGFRMIDGKAAICISIGSISNLLSKEGVVSLIF